MPSNLNSSIPPDDQAQHIKKTLDANAAANVSLESRSAIEANLKLIGQIFEHQLSAFQWKYVNKQWAAATYATDAISVTPTVEPIFQILVSPGSAQVINLDDYRIVVSPGDTVSIIVVGSGVISQADAILNWVED